MPETLSQMSKKKILITWPLPEAAMARARASYDVIAHGDKPQITIDELLETAKSVDALLITLNEKCRKDVIDRMPDNIKCISTYSIGFDHIDLEACKARASPRGHGRRFPWPWRPRPRRGEDVLDDLEAKDLLAVVLRRRDEPPPFGMALSLS